MHLYSTILSASHQVHVLIFYYCPNEFVGIVSATIYMILTQPRKPKLYSPKVLEHQRLVFICLNCCF